MCDNQICRRRVCLKLFRSDIYCCLFGTHRSMMRNQFGRGGGGGEIFIYSKFEENKVTFCIFSPFPPHSLLQIIKGGGSGKPLTPPPSQHLNAPLSGPDTMEAFTLSRIMTSIATHGSEILVYTTSISIQFVQEIPSIFI